MRDIAALTLPDATRLAGVGRGLRVLVADDERDTLMTLGVLLRSEGFEVELAHRSRDVAGIVELFRPHAVVLDIAMPHRNGYEVAKELRDVHGAHCPVLVALTGYSARIDDLLKTAGFEHHVRKPYDPVALIALLASLKTRSS